MKFITRRILTSIGVFIFVLNLDFVLPRLVPGNAAEVFASGTKLPAKAVQLISARFGLGQPLSVQYLKYLTNVFSWPPNFGLSYQFYPKTVTELIAIRMPWTVLLIVSSFFLSFTIAYTMAAYTTLRRGGKAEFASLYTSIFFWSIPAFWIAMIMAWIFGVSLGWLPIFGNSDFGVTGFWDYIASVVRHAILPVITLTAVVFGQNYFVLRGAAQNALKSDYVFAAKSRGLRKSTISYGYILRNSLLPSISLLGYSIASLISAVILVEGVFGYSGVGDLLVDAILSRDYPVIEGVFFYLTVSVIVVGLIGDLLLLRLDPRLRR